MRHKNSIFWTLFGVVMTCSTLTYVTLYKRGSSLEKTASEATAKRGWRSQAQPSSLTTKSLSLNPASATLELGSKGARAASEMNGLQKFSLQNYEAQSDRPSSCLQVALNLAFTVCTYSISEDKHVSRPLIEAGLFQPHLTSIVEMALNLMGEKAIFLELGAHIGYFSLLASALGHKSVAFEALTSNVVRMFEAATRSKLQVDIYKYAISAGPSTTSFIFEGDATTGDRGQGIFMDDGDPHEYFPYMYEPVEAISLEMAIKAALKASETQRAPIVLKMDLDTQECSIIQANEYALQMQDIPIIVMRWAFVTIDLLKPANKARAFNSLCTEQDLADMTEFLIGVAGYSPYDVETKRPLNTSDLMALKTSSWLRLQVDHHVLWIHKNVSSVVKKRILNAQNNDDYSMVQHAKGQATLVHFYNLAMNYKVFPLEISEDRLIIKNRTYRVYEDQSVRSRIDEEPLSEQKIIEMSDVIL